MNRINGIDEHNGTSIVDITDPRRPVYLAHIPGEQGGAQMVRACNGSDLATAPGSRADPSRAYLLRTYGATARTRSTT